MRVAVKSLNAHLTALEIDDRPVSVGRGLLGTRCDSVLVLARMAGISFHAAATRRDSRDFVQNVHPAIPSQRLANRPYHPALELTGRGPAVPLPLPAQNVTFPLEAHVDIFFRQGHPRLQTTVPDAPCETRVPPGHHHGFHAVAKENQDDAFQPRSTDGSVTALSSVAQRDMPGQRGQLAWLDEQRSWLEWAEISFPEAGRSPSEKPRDHEINLDIALSSADPAIPDLDSALFADDMERARWGSDPAFTTSKYVPPADQLSEGEVTSIWKEYVATSLKPFVDVNGSNTPPNQVLIVGNHNVDLGFREVEAGSTTISRALPTSFSVSKKAKSTLGLQSSPSVVKREPLPPYRGGRKRPMPPRIRPFEQEYY